MERLDVWGCSVTTALAESTQDWISVFRVLYSQQTATSLFRGETKSLKLCLSVAVVLVNLQSGDDCLVNFW